MEVLQNMQVHTTFSSCAKREMEIPSILAKASEHNLRLIAFTDHLNQPAQWPIVGQVREVMPDVPSGLRVLIGCEAQMSAPNQCSITPEVAAGCDIVLIACNHYHLRDVEKPTDKSPSGWARHHLAMIEGAIDTGFCDIIPHPFLLGKVAKEVDVDAVLAAYDPAELRRILTKAAQGRTAFELNPGQVQRALGFFKPLVAMGQDVGCMFSIGSDAHTLDALGYEGFPGGKSGVAELLAELGLRPQDVWRPRDEAAKAS